MNYFTDYGWFNTWRRLRSWISEFWDKVAYIRASSSWQATEVNNVAATTEDELRPKEKPRPPAGGQFLIPYKPEIVPILAALSSIAPFVSEE
mgnify:CR=1 FL=1